MSIIFDKTSDSTEPVELRGNHYSLGRDDGQSLMSRMSTAFLRQTGKYENNTGPTAQILKHLPLTPGWWDKTRFSGEYKEGEVGVYMCRMISDHRTFCYPDVKNAEDNIMDLDFPKFVLLGADQTLNPGAVVRIRIDNNATLHTSDIAGTIEKVIDPDATLDQFSQNCSVEIPKQGGTERTTLGECSISVGSDGRRIKISDKEVPNPPKGVWPKSPITGKRAPDTIQDPVARLAQIGTINSGFPTRNNSSDAHKGIDLRTFKNGQPGSVPVKAALDGEVWTGVINGYGNVVVIKHTAYIAPTLGSVFYTLYAHLASFSVPNGKSVKRGSQIGLSGNTVGPGRRESVPFHLHFEVIYENNKNWKTVNDVITGGAVDPVEDFFYKKFEKK